MINNFEKQVYDWLYKSPTFQSLFLVSADLTNEELSGQVVISPDVIGVDDIYLNRHVRNNGFKRYTVNVAQFNILSKIENTDVNVSILDLTKELQQWIETEVKAKRYPEIGYSILKIETSGISIASVEEDGSMKIQFQIFIDYYYTE